MSIIIEERTIEMEPVGTQGNRYSDLRNMLERCGLRVRNGVLQSDNYVTGVSGFAFRTISGTIEAVSIVAGNYIQTFVANLANIPTSVHIGDLWIVPDNNNKIYRAASVGADQITAGEWIEYGTLANWSEIVDDDSNKPEDNATATYQTFYNSTAPASGMVTGDYWIDSDDNKVYRYTGVAWGEIQDDDIAAAIADAATAQAEAESKIRTFIQTTAPTAENTGDLWYDSDDENEVYRWSSSAWVSAENLKADWAKIIGAAKPEDNATEGATAGTDLEDSGSNVLDDEDVVKYANTIYGDGSDGNLTTSGDETLTADAYYDTLTVSAGDTLYTAGYRLFCKTKLIIEATGKIDRSGGNGANGTAGTGGSGGTGVASANVQGSANGAAGGFSGVGSNGANTAVSIGVNGAAGGDTGVTTGGTAGTATQSPTKPRSYPFCVQLAHLADNVVPQLLDSSAGSGGGAGGTGGGGGGGAAGGVMLIVAREIENAGAIESHGGNGGDGNGNGNSGGGGGGGGSGGVMILIYNKYSGAGTKTVTEGSGGVGGVGDLTTGDNGDNGNTGVLIELAF